MQRRQFIQAVALSSIGALSAVDAVAAAGTRQTLVLDVKGFTCPTCAVGLDTLLGKEKGILSSHSTYPQGKVTVVFDPEQSSEKSIRTFIAGMGFTVTSVHAA